jgi:hypothetical protein
VAKASFVDVYPDSPWKQGQARQNNLFKKKHEFWEISPKIPDVEFNL